MFVFIVKHRCRRDSSCHSAKTARSCGLLKSSYSKPPWSCREVIRTENGVRSHIRRGTKGNAKRTKEYRLALCRTFDLPLLFSSRLRLTFGGHFLERIA
jgi:hypothetical protein